MSPSAAGSHFSWEGEISGCLSAAGKRLFQEDCFHCTDKVTSCFFQNVAACAQAQGRVKEPAEAGEMDEACGADSGSGCAGSSPRLA
jgi:hypothetical protein